MCGFFAFTPPSNKQAFSKLFNLDSLPDNLESLSSLKFAPTQNIPTISQNSPNQLVLRRWWLIPRWWQDDPYKVKFATFNARMEDIATKPAFRSPWQQSQRCLIPASWFYEFETIHSEGVKKPKKIPYKVVIPDNQIMAIAGLYEIWKDAQRRPIESCTMITCASVAPLNTIHQRQPVIIEKENWETWLSKDTSPEKAYQLLQPNHSLKISRIDERFNTLKV